MSLGLLFRDELKGFYKSKVMLTLWVGLPSLTLIIYFASPTSQNISLASFTAIIIGSIGGMLSAAMLVSSIISEKSRHVFDLFVIRPVKRRDIVLSKFLATYLCVTAAGIILVIYGANQLSVVAALPGLLLPSEPLLPLFPGTVVTAILLAITIRMFDRKQL